MLDFGLGNCYFEGFGYRYRAVEGLGTRFAECHVTQPHFHGLRGMYHWFFGPVCALECNKVVAYHCRWPGWSRKYNGIIQDVSITSLSASNHRNLGSHEQLLYLDIWSGDLTLTLERAAKKGQLTDLLMAHAASGE